MIAKCTVIPAWSSETDYHRIRLKPDSAQSFFPFPGYDLHPGLTFLSIPNVCPNARVTKRGLSQKLLSVVSPPARTAWSNLYLAGDWTDTGLPATIEGALRSGETAAALALRAL